MPEVVDMEGLVAVEQVAEADMAEQAAPVVDMAGLEAVVAVVAVGQVAEADMAEAAVGKLPCYPATEQLEFVLPGVFAAPIVLPLLSTY